jgi:hypothetical protein
VFACVSSLSRHLIIYFFDAIRKKGQLSIRLSDKAEFQFTSGYSPERSPLFRDQIENVIRLSN